MALHGSKRDRILTAALAAATYLNSGQGGFRGMVLQAKRAGLVESNERKPLGLRQQIFRDAVKGIPVSGLGSQKRRGVAEDIITRASEAGVILSVPQSSTPTLGLATK